MIQVTHTSILIITPSINFIFRNSLMDIALSSFIFPLVNCHCIKVMALLLRNKTSTKEIISSHLLEPVKEVESNYLQWYAPEN